MENRFKLGKAAEQVGADGLLILSRENLLYATDYWGLEGAIVVRADGKAALITDSRYIEVAASTVRGFEIFCKGAKDQYQLILEQCEALGIHRLAYEDTLTSVSAFHSLEQKLEGVELVPVGTAVNEIRSVKSAREIEYMIAAQRCAEKALWDLLPDIRPGKTERELASRLNYLMSLGGSLSTGGNILLSGPNASKPHGVPGDRKVQEGEFVLIDFGAVIHGYHSDMTRTFAVGHATEEMKKVYSTVQQAQKAGIDAFRVGARGCDVHHAAQQVIIDAGYGEYFGHGLGHSLGINIHEQPMANSRSQAIFREGNVVTMEPGIYIPGRIGVRIEDEYYLGPDGKVDLAEFPSELMIL